ncbi:MAG: hypothetical protein ABR887_04380 [Methanoregulaceae archaeon]
MDESKGNQPPLTLGKKYTRDEVELMASQLIWMLHRRSTALLFKPSKLDSPRIQYARICIAAIRVYAAILRDHDIETIKQKIEAFGQLKDVEIENLKRQIEALQSSEGDAKS